MSYITRAQLRAGSGGMPLSLIPDEELDIILQDAKDLVDSVIPQRFDYHEVGTTDPLYPTEIHAYDSDTDRLTLRERPIRKILGLTVQDAYYAGRRIGVTVDPNDIEVDNATGGGYIYSVRLNFVGGDITRILRYSYSPQLAVSYSAGYDAGYQLDAQGAPTSTPSAPDGLILPYPTWLQTATRRTALMLCGDWLGNALHGLAGFQRIVAGPFTYERPPTTPEGVPVDAARIVRQHARRVYVGSTV